MKGLSNTELSTSKTVHFMFCEFHFNLQKGKDIEQLFPPAPWLPGAAQAGTPPSPSAPGLSIARGWESCWVLPSPSRDSQASGHLPHVSLHSEVSRTPFSKFTTGKGTLWKPKRDDLVPALESPTGGCVTWPGSRLTVTVIQGVTYAA